MAFLSFPCVEVFSPTESEFENKDEFEIIKINQFYKMIKGINKIGILLGEKDKNQIKNIEKWPLIQSYGYQGK